MRMRAGAGGMPKVSGTRTATAMVAVSPGIAPIAAPATTPARARSRLSGVSAASSASRPDIQRSRIGHWDLQVARQPQSSRRALFPLCRLVQDSGFLGRLYERLRLRLHELGVL